MLAYSPDLRRSPPQQNEDVSPKGGGPDAQHGGPLRPHLPEGQAAAVPDVCQEECVTIAMGSFLTAEGDYSGCGAKPPHTPHHILVRTCVQFAKLSCCPRMMLKKSILGCTSHLTPLTTSLCAPAYNLSRQVKNKVQVYTN